MKSISFLFLFLAGQYLYSNSITKETEEARLFEIGIFLMLTENFKEADACFSQLLKRKPNENLIEVYNNRGINLAMWGLSLLIEDEADSIIKYIFPFEVAPDLRSKGIDLSDSIRRVKIGAFFNAAIQQFEYCLKLKPNYAGAWLNLSSVQAISSRWNNDSKLLSTAFRSIRSANSKALPGSATKGYSLVVIGIIYDYLNNTAKRDDFFAQAQKMFEVYPDPNLENLIYKNQKSANTKFSSTVSIKKRNFTVSSNAAETIDGISLSSIMRTGSLDVDKKLMAVVERNISPLFPNGLEKHKNEIFIYSKNYSQSTLYIYFKDVNRYYFFHRTDSAYTGKSSLGIRIGNNEAKVLTEYGTPSRIQPTVYGKYLFYKKAKIIFFIDHKGLVESWIIWRSKH